MSSLVVPAWAWGLLAGVMLVLISIDLFAHRGDRLDSRRSALVWSAVWIGAAVAFGGFVAAVFGAAAAEQFFAAYLLEKSLSVDNLFLFVVIFGALAIPAAEQRRVLTWGIVGALVTRGVFIALGAAVLHRWHEVTYVFGAILVVTAVKMLRGTEGAGSRLLPWLERHLPWTSERVGHSFVVRRAGRWVGTPLLVALLAIELTDVVFALDSIPAAFAVTDETFLVYSSNVFAVLGLRALYVVLVGALSKLSYLKYGLAAVLGFAGAKMLAAPWIAITPIVSVLVIAAVIGAAVVVSVIAARRDRGPPAITR
jgi:tellurite resistance protein TerC